MRYAIAIVLVAAGIGFAQEKIPARFNLDSDTEAFPQTTPKEALASTLKAIDQKRIDYLVAHIVDPEYVDRKVKETGGKFEKFVEVTRQKLADDPESVKELKRFLAEGEFEESGETATVKLKSVPARQVFLKKVGNRWFFENRQKAK